ncbi:fructose-bisphosphatase class II [Agromyces protaetiae]|uniref:fructose-bisphosphatase class II n=1 Tax=Agromyces protaetiae TaxID=2509455 RepID=UPI0013EAA039|nr:fructose-bisphosphatase class II [Agromyces protaetiae]
MTSLPVGPFRLAVARAAAAALPLVGSGDGDAVDGAAVDALRAALADAPVDGRVVVGEGEKDDAPMLYLGERFGTGEGPAIDLAVDPVDGTRLAAVGLPGAMAVAAVAPRGAFCDIGPAHYLEKLVTWWPDDSDASSADAGPRDILDRVPWLVARIAATRGGDPARVRVAVQGRPRNDVYADAARAAGATVEEFVHGDVERSLRAAQRRVADEGGAGAIDVLVGIGGAPEGVLVAAGVRALGGSMRARLAPPVLARTRPSRGPRRAARRHPDARRSLLGSRRPRPGRRDRPRCRHPRRRRARPPRRWGARHPLDGLGAADRLDRPPSRVPVALRTLDLSLGFHRDSGRARKARG